MSCRDLVPGVHDPDLFRCFTTRSLNAVVHGPLGRPTRLAFTRSATWLLAGDLWPARRIARVCTVCQPFSPIYPSGAISPGFGRRQRADIPPGVPALPRSLQRFGFSRWRCWCAPWSIPEITTSRSGLAVTLPPPCGRPIRCMSPWTQSRWAAPSGPSRCGVNAASLGRYSWSQNSMAACIRRRKSTSHLVDHGASTDCRRAPSDAQDHGAGLGSSWAHCGPATRGGG
ncbi:hypothetical protein NKDENANG_03078 [Candidatus Entotheonellaceae bacterium PAL068K]